MARLPGIGLRIPGSRNARAAVSEYLIAALGESNALCHSQPLLLHRLASCTPLPPPAPPRTPLDPPRSELHACSLLLQRAAGLDPSGAAQLIAAQLSAAYAPSGAALMRPHSEDRLSVSHVAAVLDLLRQNGITAPGDVRRVLSGNSSLLSNFTTHTLSQKFAWLREEVGLRRKDAAKAIIARPDILSGSIANSWAPKLAFLRELGVSNLAQVVARQPSLFSKSLGAMQGVADALRAEGLTTLQIAAVIRRQPSLISRDMAGALRRLAACLVVAGLTRVDVGPLVAKQPQLLTLAPDSLREALEGLLEMGFTEAELGAIVRSQPGILGNTPAHVRGRVAWLDAIGVPRGSMAALLPCATSLSMASLECKAAWLAGLGGVAPGEALGRFPSLLTYSIEGNLAPTAAFLVGLGYDVGVVVNETPMVLGMSLSGRMRPRAAYMAARGWPTAQVAAHFPKAASVFCASDERFCRMVGGSMEEYAAAHLLGDPDAP